MFTGLVLSESLVVPGAANAGISLSTVLNVQLPCQLMVNENLHRVRHIEGHCNDIHKGKVRVGFWVANCAGYSGSYDAFTGYISVSRIFIEEVPKPQA